MKNYFNFMVLFVILGLFVMGLNGCQGCNIPGILEGGDTTGTITGIVKDTNNRPISDATISIEGTKLTTQTNTQGQYQLNNVPVGLRTVTASKIGSNNKPLYIGQSKKVNVPTGQTVQVDFKLQSISGRISGVVYGSIPNTVIYKATVTATGEEGTYSTLTDESGRYELDVLAGTYTVTVTKETFNDANINVTVGVDETKTQDFHLTTGSGGTISNPPNVLSWWVTAYTTPSEMDIRSLKIKPSRNGKLEFEPKSLPLLMKNSGDYKSLIVLQVNINISDNTGVKGVRFYKSDSPNGPFTLIDNIIFFSFPLEPYSTGLAFDSDLSITPGVPSKYYTFSFWGDSGESSMQKEPVRTIPLQPCILSSPSNGATVGPTPIFSWNAVPDADRYSINVFETANSSWGNSIWSSWNINASQTSITYGDGGYPSPAPTLVSGKTYGWVVYAYRHYTDLGGDAVSTSYLREFSVSSQTGTIQGTVKDTNNQPIQGATVSVEGTSLQATTNSQGYYQITDVPAGTRTVTASKTGYNSQSKTVNIVAGQTITVDFQLQSSTSEIVIFADSNLEQAVRDTLGIPAGQPITKEKMKELKILNANWNSIFNLSGLEYAINLQELNLWANEIKDISPLSNLSNLWLLWLSNNQISDISPLANLTNLQMLDLEDNQISDISPLANLTNLQWLDISDNQISDISPLANLTNLQWLDISDNQISDISPLVSNTGLGQGDVVDLKNNPLDLTPGSDDMKNIQILQNRGVTVYY
jgi:protocatechuate 3,4-dioxygenase beta subunit